MPCLVREAYYLAILSCCASVLPFASAYLQFLWICGIDGGRIGDSTTLWICGSTMLWNPQCCQTQLGDMQPYLQGYGVTKHPLKRLFKYRDSVRNKAGCTYSLVVNWSIHQIHKKYKIQTMNICKNSKGICLIVKYLGKSPLANLCFRKFACLLHEISEDLVRLKSPREGGGIFGDFRLTISLRIS